MYTHIPIWVRECKGLENVRLSKHCNIRLCSVFIMLSHKVVHRSFFIIIIYKMKGMIIQNNDNPALSLGNSLVIMLNSSTTEKNSHYLCEENL